jgi:hypothetical protein
MNGADAADISNAQISVSEATVSARRPSIWGVMLVWIGLSASIIWTVLLAWLTILICGRF